MSIASALAQQPELHTPRLRLVQLGPEHFEATFAGLDDAESMRLTGTRGTFTPERVQTHLNRLPGAEDRADFAIFTLEGEFVGEVVLNDLEEDDLAMNYRIALANPSVRGKGYGTEAGKAVVALPMDEVVSRRISLTVYSFNPGAQRSYAKIGFQVEGLARHTMLWDGEWVDSVLMSMLSTDPRP